jgi:membrane protease YdiL (CAAX protease family)
MTEVLALLSILIVGVIFSLAGEVLFKPVETYKKSVAFALYGITSATLIMFFISYLCKKIGIQSPVVGSVKHLFAGMFFGAAATSLAGLLYLAVYRPRVSIDRFFADLNLQLIANISPAVIEETAFRGGVVHLIFEYAGAASGALGGGVIFGVAHLCGALVGRAVDLHLVLGASSAGLFLSLIYLRYGLGAAIAAHWLWNSFHGSWVGAFSIPIRGARALEANWTTIIVFVLLSLIVAFVPLQS